MSWSILLKKKEFCAIVNTNTNKNLIYEVILAIIKSFVLLILLIIALIKDQVKTFSKYYL